MQTISNPKIACARITTTNDSKSCVGDSILQTFGEMCLRLSPQITKGRSAIFIEIGKCQSIYPKPESIASRLKILGSRMGVEVNIGFGHSFSEAYCASLGAIFQPQDNAASCALFESLSPDWIPFVIDPLGIRDELFEAASDLVQNLNRLGIKTIRDFLRLPRSAWLKQSGYSIQYFLQNIDTHWPTFKKTEIIIETLETECPPTLEPMLFALKTLFDRLTSRMYARQLKISKLRLKMRQQSYPNAVIQSFDLPFSKPQGSSLSLITLVRDQLNVQWKPIQKSRNANIENTAQELIDLFSVEVLESVESKGAQPDLIDKRLEEHEKLSEVISRLAQGLGVHAVKQHHIENSHMPEHAFSSNPIEDLLSDHQSSHHMALNPYLPPRPLRLFSPAISVRILNGLIDTPSGAVKILHTQGPERISGDWWEQALSAHDDDAHDGTRDFSPRDYYTFLVQSGPWLWVYQTPDRKFFLHGVFD